MDGATITEREIRQALTGVSYPGLKRDIVSFGILKSVSVHNARAHVALVVASARPEIEDQLRSSIREALAAIGVVRTEVQILAPERRATGVPDPWADRGRLIHVKRILAVGSGKGGVGKSTVAVNLALALQAAGNRVGVLDADIYGPSIPIILGLEDGAQRMEMTADRKVVPLEAHGLAVVSFGFFLGPESPAIWRGPMVSKAVRQFSRGVVWPEMDFLVVDLPPGTGDVPLSLAQSVVIDGAVVVTTPQRLAVQEAEKAVGMFRKLDARVLGVVENMSFSTCGCGSRSYPFGRGGGRELAGRAGTALLGEIPLEGGVMAGQDTGLPPVIAHPDSRVAQAFAGIAAGVADALATRPDLKVAV